MRALGLFIKSLIMLAVVMIGAIFALENNQTISVDFIVLHGPEISLGLWLILFLAIGALLGMIASSLIIAGYRRRLARFKKGMKKV
jgi:putative membrane protein